MTKKASISILGAGTLGLVCAMAHAGARSADFDGDAGVPRSALEYLRAHPTEVAMPPLTPVADRPSQPACAIERFTRLEADVIFWDSRYSQATQVSTNHRGARPVMSRANRAAEKNRQANYDAALALVSDPESLRGCSLGKLERFSIAMDGKFRKESRFLIGNGFLKPLYDAAEKAGFDAASESIKQDLQLDHRPEKLAAMTKEYEVLAAAVKPNSRIAAYCHGILALITSYRQATSLGYEECEGCP